MPEEYRTVTPLDSISSKITMPFNPSNIAPTIREMLQKSQVSWGVKRLFLEVTHEKLKVDYSDLSQMIKSDRDNHVFVPDTCFLTAHEVPNPFWDSILEKRIAITSSVFQELIPWMESPNFNSSLVSLIKKSQDEDSSIVVSADSPPSAWGRHLTMARCFYVTLLTSRKDRALELVNDLKKQSKHEVTAFEIQRLLQKNYSSRELKMILKAVQQGHCQNWWTDESLVVSALFIGITTGQPTTILTRDRDVLEQFEKLCSLLTIDYQSYLFGQYFNENHVRLERAPMPNDEITEAYFETSQSYLVKKTVPPNDFTEWILPRSFAPVKISCALFGGPPDEMSMQVVSYQAEGGMLDLLRTKSEAQGRNASLPNDLNCHVTGFPKSIPTPREFVIIGKDRWRYPNSELEMRWSKLDCSHALLDDGIYKRLPRWID